MSNGDAPRIIRGMKNLLGDINSECKRAMMDDTPDVAPLDRPRSWEEITAEMRRLSASGEDFFGTMTIDLVSVLPFNHASEFLNEDAVKEGSEGWEKDRAAYSRLDVVNRIKEYLDFAWDKANNCRGLSAARSRDHFRAWFFLLGDEKFVDDIEHRYYGKPLLVAISERDDIAFPWTKHDNDCWANSEMGRSETAKEALGR